jgi:hypothetical protein
MLNDYSGRYAVSYSDSGHVAKQKFNGPEWALTEIRTCKYYQSRYVTDSTYSDQRMIGKNLYITYYQLINSNWFSKSYIQSVYIFRAMNIIQWAQWIDATYYDGTLINQLSEALGISSYQFVPEIGCLLGIANELVKFFNNHQYNADLKYIKQEITDSVFNRRQHNLTTIPILIRIQCSSTTIFCWSSYSLPNMRDWVRQKNYILLNGM